MFQAFFIPFIAISLAELGDKTQIAILLLATRTGKHLYLFLGVLLAFVIADGLAVLLGGLVADFVPAKYLKVGSGIIFIIFGILTIVKNEEGETTVEPKNPFFSAFGLIFASELGDKTQIASGLFATKYNPYLVFTGVILALAMLSLMAIFVGRFVKNKINRRLISLIGGVVFIIIGIVCLVG